MPEEPETTKYIGRVDQVCSHDIKKNILLMKSQRLHLSTSKIN